MHVLKPCHRRKDIGLKESNNDEIFVFVILNICPSFISLAMINTLTISKLEEKEFIEFTVLDSDHYYGEVKEGT